MLRIPSRTTTTARVRVQDDSGWEESVPARWTAQLVVGGLPGILACLIIMWMVGKPSGEGAHAHIASMVPLLSASGLADSPAFHRLQAGPGPGTGGLATHAPQFRTPEGLAAEPAAAGHRQGSQDAAPAAMAPHAPRTAWTHLSPGVRASIDAGLAGGSHARHRLLLHGSGAGHGSARLIERYHAAMRGQGKVYHFVIGNGSGAADGLVETGARWSDVADEGDIEVCLVGDFNERAPTQAQMEALHELTDYLSIKLGKMELAEHQAGCLGSKFTSGVK